MRHAVLVTTVSAARPLLRGVIHQAAFLASLVVGTLLIVGANGPRGHVAASVFAASVAVCFGVSALYHRITWTPRLRVWMRTLDHAGIYVLISGTYTPIGLLVLRGSMRWTVLALVWAGTAVAIVLRFTWAAAPKWVAAAIGLALGWVSVIALPEIVARLDPAAVGLLLAGGLTYSAGAVVYVRRRPNPAPRIFGYHELFHALTILAAACQYVAIAFFVIRVG
jgi:hemolysin III